MTVRNLTGAVNIGVSAVGTSEVFTIGQSLIGTGQIGSGPWQFEDMSAKCMSLSVQRGRGEPNGALRVGTATVELSNFDGKTLWTSSDPTSSGFIAVGSPIVAGAQAYGNGPITPVFTGRVETIRIRRNMANTKQTLVLLCVEDSRALATSLSEHMTGDGLGETSGDRVNRFLDQLEPAPTPAQRNIANGHITMEALGVPDDRPLVDLIAEVAFCEGGDFFMARDGRWTFKGRRIGLIGSFPALEAGDQSTDVYRLPNLELSYTDEHVKNRVTINGVTVSNTTSIAKLGRRDFRATGLPIANGTTGAQDCASYWLNRFLRRTFCDAVTLTSAREPWSDVLPTLELFDIVKFRRRFAPRLASQQWEDFEIHGHIDSLSHSWEAGSPWSTTIAIATS